MFPKTDVSKKSAPHTQPPGWVCKYLFSVLLLTLLGCNNNNETIEDGKIKAVSTITIINDMVKNIGGEKVNAVSICPVGTDPHTYIAKPSDPKMVSESDIVFINGLGLEHWMEQMIKNAGGERPVVTVTEGITPMYDESGFGDPDPHAWFNLELTKIYAKNIANGLISVDPENESYYNSNLKNYVSELDNAHNEAKRQILEIPQESRVLITSHDAFRYFGNAYGLEVHGLQGISTESKPRTEDVKNIIDLVKEKNLKAVFIETTVNPALLQQITNETGAVIGGTLYSDSIGEPGSDGETFISAFKSNVAKVINALK